MILIYFSADHFGHVGDGCDRRGKIQLSLAWDSSTIFEIITTQEAYHVKRNQYKPPKTTKSETMSHQLKTNATESTAH